MAVPLLLLYRQFATTDAPLRWRSLAVSAAFVGKEVVVIGVATTKNLPHRALLKSEHERLVHTRASTAGKEPGGRKRPPPRRVFVLLK